MIQSIRPFNNLTYIKENEKHFICRCPFCGDSTNPNHGHLYLDKNRPSVYCYKCGWHSLSQLEKVLKEPCKVTFNVSVTRDLPQPIRISNILSKVQQIIIDHYEEFSEDEKIYFQKRLRIQGSFTLDTAIRFNILPDSFCRRTLLKANPSKYFYLKKDCTRRVWTVRGFGTGVSGRAINICCKTVMRYVNGSFEDLFAKDEKNSDLSDRDQITIDNYFIRSSSIANSTSSPQNLIICEGVYDCGPLYLNGGKYGLSEEDSLYVAVQCSSYDRGLKLYKFMYDGYPKRIMLFLDSNIKLEMINKQFKDVKGKIEIICHYPMVKDWEETGPVKYKINLGGYNDKQKGKYKQPRSINRKPNRPSTG